MTPLASPAPVSGTVLTAAGESLSISFGLANAATVASHPQGAPSLWRWRWVQVPSGSRLVTDIGAPGVDQDTTVTRLDGRLVPAAAPALGTETAALGSQGVFSEQATASAVLDVAGVYIARVAASDGCYVSEADAVVVVGADVPLLFAGVDYTIPLGDGSGHVLWKTRYLDVRGQLVATPAQSRTLNAMGLQVSWTVVSQPSGGNAQPVSTLFPMGANVLSPRFVPQAVGTYVLRITTTETPTRAGSTNAGVPSSVRMETVRVEVTCGFSPSVSIEADDNAERISASRVSAPIVSGPGDDDFGEAERGTGVGSAVWALGATVGLDASSTTDADSTISSLTFSWSLIDGMGLPRVRRPGSIAMGFSRAAQLQPAITTALTRTSLTAASGNNALATFVPDGIGTFEASLQVSDGCSAPSSDSFRVEVVCPASPVATVQDIPPFLLVPGENELPGNITV